MILTGEEARNIVFGYNENWEHISGKMTGQRRWVTEYTSIFKHIESGKYYLFNYDQGSTESCEEQPFEWEDSYTPVEVERKKVTTYKYVPVKKSK